MVDNHAFNGEILTGDLNNLNFDPLANNKKILIASRHFRNDSKTIQLELRYDNINATVDDSHKLPVIKSRKNHKRSSSCDVKITRSNSRDYDGGDFRLRKHFPSAAVAAATANNTAPAHYSRTGSRDPMNDGGDSFRAKLTHQRTASRDSGSSSSNIKYILNYLHASNPRATASKKHSRNHSYDQIYMPNNIKIDQELHRKFHKNGGRKNSRDHDVNVLQQQPAVVIKASGSKECDPDLTTSQVIESIYHHSRNNSKDLNYLVDDVGGGSGLRHRRTNSKDLNRIADGGGGGGGSGRHSRSGSHHKIDSDSLGPAEPIAAAHLLLLRPPPSSPPPPPLASRLPPNDSSFAFINDDDEAVHVDDEL